MLLNLTSLSLILFIIRECPPYTGIGHLVNLFEKETPDKTPFEMPADRKKRVSGVNFLSFLLFIYDTVPAVLSVCATECLIVSFI